jgi:hypothetical protein
MQSMHSNSCKEEKLKFKCKQYKCKLGTDTGAIAILNHHCSVGWTYIWLHMITQIDAGWMVQLTDSCKIIQTKWEWLG